MASAVLAGFRPVKQANGSPWNGQVNRYMVAAADGVILNVGDLVVLGSGAAITDPVTGGVFPVVTRAITATTAAVSAAQIVGPVVGFEPDYSNLNLPNVRSASTYRIALVADAPGVIMACPQDAVGGVVAAASVGLNVAIIGTAVPSTAAPAASTMCVDSSSVSTTNTLPLQVVGVTANPDNDAASTSRPAELLVRINSSAMVGGATGQTGV